MSRARGSPPVQSYFLHWILPTDVACASELSQLVKTELLLQLGELSSSKAFRDVDCAVWFFDDPSLRRRASDFGLHPRLNFRYSLSSSGIMILPFSVERFTLTMRRFKSCISPFQMNFRSFQRFRSKGSLASLLRRSYRVLCLFAAMIYCGCKTDRPPDDQLAHKSLVVRRYLQT